MSPPINATPRNLYQYPINTPFGVIERTKGPAYLKALLYGEAISGARPNGNGKASDEDIQFSKQVQTRDSTATELQGLRRKLFLNLSSIGVPKETINSLTAGRVDVRREVLVANRQRYNLGPANCSLYLKVCKLSEGETQDSGLSLDEQVIFPPGWDNDSVDLTTSRVSVDEDGGDLFSEFIRSFVDSHMALQAEDGPTTITGLPTDRQVDAVEDRDGSGPKQPEPSVSGEVPREETDNKGTLTIVQNGEALDQLVMPQHDNIASSNGTPNTQPPRVIIDELKKAV